MVGLAKTALCVITIGLLVDGKSQNLIIRVGTGARELLLEIKRL